MLSELLFWVFMLLSSIFATIITFNLLLWRFDKHIKKIVKDIAQEFADDIFNDASAMLEDKIHDSNIVDALIEKLFESVRQMFAASKATSVRQQKAASKRIVNYFLKQAPMANLILEESGAKEYFEKNPSLLIWGMETFPGLFNLGGGGGNQSHPQNSPIGTNSPIPPPPPIEMPIDALQNK